MNLAFKRRFYQNGTIVGAGLKKQLPTFLGGSFQGQQITTFPTRSYNSVKPALQRSHWQEESEEFNDKLC